MAASGCTVVLGLGNPILSDDGVGLAVAAELKRLLAVAPIRGVDVLASTRAGFELIDLLRGYARAVILDCIVLPDPQPGRVCRLTLDDVSGCARLVNAHEVSVGTAFRLAERMGIPMPHEAEIIAVEAADTATLAEGLTPMVQATVAPLAREIYESLKRNEPATDPLDAEEFSQRRAFYSPGDE
ncbi:MAG TPA: hydrogenase maturation protease [Candidatus Methylomirabilis sp.]|nr:hydrogenase maturation protease [Candidatus Methylomirabilis sp.]